MSDRSRTTKDARRLEKVYDTKAHGTKHRTVMQLIHDRGLDGAIEQLEAWGLKRTEQLEDSADEPCGVCHYLHCVCPR